MGYKDKRYEKILHWSAQFGIMYVACSVILQPRYFDISFISFHKSRQVVAHSVFKTHNKI